MSPPPLTHPKKENETVKVKRRCEGLVSVEAFDIFSQGGDVESFGDVSWEESPGEA